MRPVRLELEGFTSFRERTVVDFAGADYFALVGPTGAGKSSIIDAICFVLYGSVPRYDDKRLVAPVVSAGSLETKVRLDFTVGQEAYTAVRVVRRGGKGASVKEARLEKAGADEPLAGTGPELTARVIELLGLTFEHFTKCVVLPQGDFARFLHDDPKDRQEFLVKLLNLGLYQQMAAEANSRSAAAKERRTLLLDQLERSLDGATPERLAEVKSRVKRLAKLRKEATEAEPALQAFEKQIVDARTELEETRDWLETIGELEVPEEVGTLGDSITAAKKLAEEAEGRVKDVRAKVIATQKTLDGLPQRGPLDKALLAHTDLDEITKSLTKAAEVHDEARQRDQRAATALREAEAAELAARSALDEARSAHSAQHLAEALVAGEACPVCLQPVTALPEHERPADIDKADKALTSAAAALEKTRAERNEEAAALAAAKERMTGLTRQRDVLTERIAEHQDRAAVEETLAAIEAAESEEKAARSAEGRALDAADEARKELEKLQHQALEQREGFTEVRDELALLKPPKVGNKDLAADWDALIAWATSQIPALEKKVAASEQASSKAGTARDELISKLTDSCVECEVELDGAASVVEAVVTAHTTAEREVKDIESAIAEAKNKKTEADELERTREVAHELGLHLSAKPGRFVSWVVNEALVRLAEGATEILGELSGERYSLHVDENGAFFVTDLHNAGERRSARTLSGGETFLASLSLALALADQLTELAAEGAARLEAIFLDEGFGTLDPETLATVAATVENLAARGRMVGVITHVRELADQIPTQFRVQRDVRTSRIEKVSA